MIPLSVNASNVIRQGSFSLASQASVTLAGKTIASGLPLVSGAEDYDGSLRVPESVRVTIPRLIDGVDFSPRTATSPLSPYGQRLRIRLGIGLQSGAREWFNRGEFLIVDAAPRGDVIEVSAVGLLGLVDEARLITPFIPSGTFKSAVRKLVEPALTVRFDPALIDRAVPGSLNYDDSRLDALYGVLDAWPARAYVHPNGYLHVVGANAYAAADLHFVSNGDNPAYSAVFIADTSGATRDDIYNCVVARGTTSDGLPIQSVAYDTSGGPASTTGPFNALPVPFFYESPLLTTVAQCAAAAKSILARKAAPAARRWELEMIPDPRLIGGDCLFYVMSGASSGVASIVEKLTLPYTADGGSEQITFAEAGSDVTNSGDFY